jgi:uncharacterized membrane protein
MKSTNIFDQFGSPRFWLHFHGWLTVAWFFQFPLVLVIEGSLKKSTPYLVIISIAAAALGEMSAWQAARVEVRVAREALSDQED